MARTCYEAQMPIFVNLTMSGGGKVVIAIQHIVGIGEFGSGSMLVLSGGHQQAVVESATDVMSAIEAAYFSQVPPGGR